MVKIFLLIVYCVLPIVTFCWVTITKAFVFRWNKDGDPIADPIFLDTD